MCRRDSITETTFFRWRNKYGGMEVSDARRLKELEHENAKLKRLVAEQLPVIDGLKEFVGEKGVPRRVGVQQWSSSRVGEVTPRPVFSICIFAPFADCSNVRTARHRIPELEDADPIC